MEAIKIEGLSKNFGALEVLRDLHLTVEAGEYVAVIGPNGAGKTTLLNVLSGVLPVAAGRIYMFGQDITSMPAHCRAHIGLARSFQIARLFGNLTVLQNISLALQGMRPSRYQMFRSAIGYGDVMAKAHNLLELIDLWVKRNEPMKALSYGEQRKMEFVLSLASEPRVLLLDEPSAGLGVAEIPNFVNTIKDLAKGTTLIFVAHDMDVVFDLARRILVLYIGQFIADGTPEEIRANPKVNEIYLGIEEDRTNARAD
jgi:branched-chain amino acid transport system ATP-binding protein